MRKEYASIEKQENMNSDTKNPPPLVVADETISLINDNAPLPVLNCQYESNDKDQSKMLTRKSLIQQRLMRWCAFILSIGTIILIWRYISILILALWLSSICRPLLECLVNRL